MKIPSHILTVGTPLTFLFQLEVGHGWPGKNTKRGVIHRGLLCGLDYQDDVQGAGQFGEV